VPARGRGWPGPRRRARGRRGGEQVLGQPCGGQGTAQDLVVHGACLLVHELPERRIEGADRLGARSLLGGGEQPHGSPRAGHGVAVLLGHGTVLVEDRQAHDVPADVGVAGGGCFS
jgi:hypothetical protein